MHLRSRTFSYVGLVLFACMAATSVSASAATYYVRTVGNDTNNGTSPSSSFRSITKAANVAIAGDIIWIGAGTYDNNVVPLNGGTSVSPIQYRADTYGDNTGDAGTVLLGGNSARLTVVGKSYLQFYALHFGGSSSYGGAGIDEDDVTEGVDFVRFESCVGILMRDCDLRNAEDALYVKSAEVNVETTYIQDNNKNGIKVEGSTSKLKVYFSIIGQCGGRGIFVKDAVEVIIEDSKIFDNGDHGVRSEADTNTDTLTIRRCEIYENNHDGVHLHNKGPTTLENCLIHDNVEHGYKTHGGSPISTINHCIFVNNHKDGIRHEKGTMTVTNTIFANNLVNGLEKAGANVTNSYSCSYGNGDTNWKGTAAGTGSITLDPKFTSSTDYHLQSSSPCVDTGTGSMSLDLESTARPIGGAVDMGCYERGTGSGGSGKIYYVRTSGSDRRNGLTPAGAFRNIAKAVSVMVAGDTVYVGAGTYGEAPSLVSMTGTSSNQINFNADTDGTKTGDAGTVTVGGGFYLQNSSYINIRLFTLSAGTRKATWSSYYTGAHLSGTSNIQLENLACTGGSYGFLVDNGTSITFSGCSAQSATTHGFCIQGTSTGTLNGCQANSNSQAGFYAATGTMNLSGCTSSSNSTHGFRYNAARGTLTSCSSTSDCLGAQLLGVGTDRTSITATNFTIQSSTNGAALLQVCTASIVAGAQALTTGGSYGVYVDNASLTLTNAVIQNRPYGVQVVNGGTAALSNCTISNCTNEGVDATASTATVSNSTISNCRTGIKGSSNSTVTATTCTLNGNSAWGINVSGHGTVNGCTLTNNYQGVSLTGQTTRGDITIGTTTIDGTTREGLVAIRCTGNVSGAATKLSQAGSYGAYIEDSNLTLSNFKIQSGPTYGITAYGSTLAVSGGTITGAPSDGIYLSNCQTTVTGSTISSNRYGIYSQDGGSLTVDNCTLATNSSWAILHTGYGAINNSTINNNQQGLYLVGASATGDITLSNTKVQGTTAEGLALFKCTGTIPAGTDKVSKGGSYGVYLSASNITMTAPEITGPQYGFLCYSSTLAVNNGTISGCSLDGVYAEGSTLNLTSCAISTCRYGVRTINASTLNAQLCTLTSNTAWAINHSGYGLIADCTLTNNYQGLYAIGQAQTTDVTLDDVIIQGTTREGLMATRCTGTVLAGSDKLSKGGSYGAYLSQSNLSLSGGVQITGPSYGIQCYNSTLTLPNAVITDLAQDGIYASQSSVTMSGCQIARCRYGVRGTLSSTLVASSSTIDSTTMWGIYHTGYGTITNCTLNNCTQGMYVTGQTQSSDLQLVNATIKNTAKEGLVAIRAQGTVQDGTGRLSQGGSYGAYLSQANITFTDVSIISAQYGIISYSSTFNLTDSDISSTSVSGIMATGSTITLTNDTITDCGLRGIDCQADSTVNATGCQIERCADWGIILAGFGTLTSCVVNDNQYGANFTGKTNRGDIRLVNLTLNDSTEDGLIATRCDGNVLGGATFSGGGDWGLYSSDSKLTLSNATLSNNTYGIYSESSDVTVNNSRVANATYGVYSTADQNLTLSSSRIENCTNWALQSYEGHLQATNCVIANNSRGVYVENAYQAKLWNSTLASNTLFGLSQSNGLVELKNTIISGSNQGVGIQLTGGSLTSSNNLVYGFATNFSGFTPDSNTLVKNPRFANPEGSDYRLSKGSPAINAGVSLAGNVDLDILGQARPTFMRWEIGAYEYAADDASLRILQWGEQR